ncbi:hypothetical protein GIB67_014013, partial [Kingdonia uniflora]
APNNWGQPSQFAIPTQFQHLSSFANPSQSQSSQSHNTQSVDLSQSEDAGAADGQKNKGKRRSTTKNTNGGRGVSVVEMDGYSKQKSSKSLGSCLRGYNQKQQPTT